MCLHKVKLNYMSTFKNIILYSAEILQFEHLHWSDITTTRYLKLYMYYTINIYTHVIINNYVVV